MDAESTKNAKYDIAYNQSLRVDTQQELSSC